MATISNSLIQTINALLYTLLAFLVPLYWTCKSILRQYTSVIIATSAQPIESEELEVEMNDMVVPSTFTEEKSKVESYSAAVSSSSSNATPQTQTPTSTQIPQSRQWLYYWSLLAIVHCFTGIYERVLLPLVGNSFLYRCTKFAGIYWLAANDAYGAQVTWNSFVGPLVSKHEKDVDALVALLSRHVRQASAKAVTAAKSVLHEKIISKIKTA